MQFSENTTHCKSMLSIIIQSIFIIMRPKINVRRSLFAGKFFSGGPALTAGRKYKSGRFNAIHK